MKASDQRAASTDVQGRDMTDGPGFHGLDEDLRRVAAEGFELADRLCRGCGQMHALWPYIRLARATSAGSEEATSRLQSVLADQIAAGRKDVLIAGAADTGALATVARAGAGRALDIVVLDRCETPLELCRRQAQHWSLPIATLHEDLGRLDRPGRFDIVFAHGTLHFIELDRRTDVLARMRRTLRPGGRLVLRANAGGRIGGELAGEGRDGYPAWVAEELARIGVALPEPADAFRERLRMHAMSREAREGAFAAPEEIKAALTQAGFVIRDWLELGVKLSAPVEDFQSKAGKRRFLAVAEPAA
jgi:SAM-dependent methyltransferase